MIKTLSNIFTTGDTCYNTLLQNSARSKKKVDTALLEFLKPIKGIIDPWLKALK